MIDISNRTTYTAWTEFVDGNGETKTYRCHKCKSFAGKLKYRHVTERTGGAHREYKVECAVCEHDSGVYWSKILAEKTWEAESDPYYQEQKVVRTR